MSLDVYLHAHERLVECQCECCGHKHQRHTYDYGYSANITHNLGAMAQAAGIYYHLWRPDEIGVTHAKQLIDPLRNGLEELRLDPDYFKTFNPKNGRGDYDGFVRFVEEYLKECTEVPEAVISVSR